MSIAHPADTSGQPISLMADSASDLVCARTQVGDFADGEGKPVLVANE